MALSKLSLFHPVFGTLTNIPTSVSFTLSTIVSRGGYTGVTGTAPAAVFNGIFGSAIATPPVPVATSLHDGTVGSAYTVTISVQGGTAPYVFSVASGTLPTATSLNASTGVISGTPTVVGTFTFSISATDTNKTTGTTTFSLNISAASSGGNYGVSG